MGNPRGRPASGVLAAVRCSLYAAAALVLTLSLIAEIAAVPTADPGIHSDTWTPITAVTALFLGQQAFHGSFALGSIALGLQCVPVGLHMWQWSSPGR